MAKHWQAQVSYQYGNATQFFVGDQRNDAAGPGGQAPHRKVSIFDVGILYGVSNRVSLDLTVPFLSGHGVSMRQAVGTSAACGVPISWAGAAAYMEQQRQSENLHAAPHHCARGILHGNALLKRTVDHQRRSDSGEK